MHDAQPLPHDCSGSKYTPCPTVGWHTCMHALNITHTRGHMHARAHTPPYTHTHTATHMYRLYMKVCKVWHCVHVRVCLCLWACLWARVCVHRLVVWLPWRRPVSTGYRKTWHYFKSRKWNTRSKIIHPLAELQSLPIIHAKAAYAAHKYFHNDVFRHTE